MKPPLFVLRFSTPGLLLFGVLLGLLLPLQAQISTTIGSVVKGFSFPQHNDEGELISKISGAQSNTVSPNRAVIKELSMEFYNKGEVTMKVTSPNCDYWFLQSRLNTRDGVKIERENMTITAQNFQWEEKTKRGVLQKNVSVVLKNFNLSKAISTTPPRLETTPPSIETPESITPVKDPGSPVKLDLNSTLPDISTPQETPTP